MQQQAMTDLERRLQERFRQIAEEETVALGRPPHYFLRMLVEYENRPVDLASALLAGDPRRQTGLTDLAIAQRLDLTVEHVILEPQFALLFSESKLADARRRLGR